jgi:hypothetical protein
MDAVLWICCTWAATAAWQIAQGAEVAEVLLRRTQYPGAFVSTSILIYVAWLNHCG